MLTALFCHLLLLERYLHSALLPLDFLLLSKLLCLGVVVARTLQP